MSVVFQLFEPGSVGLTVVVISLIAAAGLSLGSIRYKGLGLGIGGVLFAGLFFGALVHQLQRAAGGKEVIHHEVLHFAREFGLILFVYTIGIQVGPGFLASFKKEGFRLNMLAALIVLVGALVTVGLHYVAGVRMQDAVGLLSGAVTNTPSMGAAEQALKNKGVNATGLGAGYAIAYPFGIMGIILTMIGVRYAFRISLAKETEQFEKDQAKPAKLSTISLKVTNANLHGLPLRDIPSFADSGVVISRVMHQDRLHVARPDTLVQTGDVLLAVGPREKLDQLQLVVGSRADVDLTAMPSNITPRRIIVTQNGVLGKTVEDLDLRRRLGVNVTRIRRGEVELAPSPHVHLQFGDIVMTVGEPDGVNRAAAELGDSPKKLNHPQVIPMFVGIALGVILGSIPFYVPGIPAPVKLGLAGGPLIVAIILSRLGHFGPLVWYLPQSSNFILREVGIVMFLACVGLMSADKFFGVMASGQGLVWMGYGALITLIPLMVAATIGRMVFKINYLTLCGLLAGSMTDPPALQFAGAVTNSDAPSISYATVYPLTMLLRVVTAQMLVLLFA